MVANALSQNPLGQLFSVIATQWKMLEDPIKVNLVCKLKLLMANLSILNDIVVKIKVA